MLFINELSGESKLSKGNSELVAKEVLKSPEKMGELIACLNITDEVVQIRAMNAIIYISKRNSQLLSPYKRRILRLFEKTHSPETKWQIVQCFKHFDFPEPEQNSIYLNLEKCLFESHKFLISHSIEALGDHIQKYKLSETDFISKLKQLAATGSPAVQVRARKVLKKFDH